MKKTTLIIILYLFQIPYVWGSLMADIHYRDVHDWPLLKSQARDDVGIVAMESLMPFSVVWTPFVTNFNEHGWELWFPHENYD